MYERGGPFDFHPGPSLQDFGILDGPPAGHPERLLSTQELLLSAQTPFLPGTADDLLHVPDPSRPAPSLKDELAHLLGAPVDQQTHRSVVPRPRTGSHDHRKRRRPSGRLQAWSWVRGISVSLAALTTVIVAMVSAFGAVISYNPLRHLATPVVPSDLAQCWPLLVFGPWLVASLSVLRAALHHRRAAHSWTIVVLFSALAVTLCVNHADKTLAAIAVAGLPPLAALTCFHQLVRQITLTRPHRRPPRHRPHRAQP